MLYSSPKNPNTKYTAKERNKPSFPTRILVEKNLVRGKVLDFGSGFGADGKFLRKHGFKVKEYDPYYAPDYPQEKFDTIICNYVLNVLLQKEQSYVLMAISELLKEDGAAYYSVRRDLKKTGYRLHVKHLKKTYQCNVVLPYKTVFKIEHCEIYQYKSITAYEHDESKDCVFCNPVKSRSLLTESALAYSMLDKFPVSDGHCLIIPKTHEPNYFNLPDKYQQACNLVLDRTKKLLNEKYEPDGYNIGINIGESAGQTIDHVHIHLIPRFRGDVQNPTGGIRNLIDGKGDYKNN